MPIPYGSVAGRGRAAALSAALAVTSVWGCAGELTGSESDYIVPRSGTGGATGSGGSSGTGGSPGACDATPVLAQRCGTAFCHDSTTRSQGLDLAAAGVASRLVGVKATSPGCTDLLLIDPGNTQSSMLLQKVVSNPPPCGAKMPITGTLPAEDLSCIQSWVASFAGGGTP